MFLESPAIQPSVSGVTEMFQDLGLVLRLDSIPFHRVGMRARGAGLSTFLILETKKGTRRRLEVAWE